MKKTTNVFIGIALILAAWFIYEYKNHNRYVVMGNAVLDSRDGKVYVNGKYFELHKYKEYIITHKKKKKR